jgi:hypothetical protein
MIRMQGKQQQRCLALVLAFFGVISLWGMSNQHPPVAHAMSQENNGVGLTPALGWSSWSFIRHNPTAAGIEAQADAMKNSGLAWVGFQYVNLDDFWYQCPGSQGPNVDAYGRWVTDTSKFPNSGSIDGIQVVANYVHHDHLKFGLYVTPGISQQAVAQNTPIEGTTYHAADIATTTSEKNYNCKGMVGIDYTKPGAQEFINSWANQFASWGIDYLKIDGVGTSDIPDIQAWSAALRQTGRPIHLELSNSLSISSASTWAQYSHGWRTGGDIECYGCEASGSSYPLTDWSHVQSRFNQVANWQPYGGPGGFNDYDSLEIGNGSNDGLTPAERQTQMSLWALAASPLILGTDLTHLDPTDLGYLRNRDVLAVDQDSIDASRIVNSSSAQVFAKTERNGNVIVGLFNLTSEPEVISTTASTLDLPAGTAYVLNDLWTHQTTETAGAISPNIPPHGVALYRVIPTRLPILAPPNATLAVSDLSSVTAGQPVSVTESFTNNGQQPVQRVQLDLQPPSGWSVKATSPTLFPTVTSQQTVQATFQVVAAQPTGLFQTNTVTSKARYAWLGRTALSLSVDEIVTISVPVQSPYQTFSSAKDAPAIFEQVGQQFGISGAGPDLWSSSDTYSSIYLHGSIGNTSTIQTEVVSQQSMTGYAKAGIMVRNDITGVGSSPEGVVLFESPSGGFQLEWDSNGGNSINSVTPPNGTISESLPVWLKLVKNGSTFTGYYSLDGSTWNTVGTATVPAQATTQDAGMFIVSHVSGSPGQVIFQGFSVQ